MDNNASIDKSALDANIARTVDKAALRKVRNLVDNFERNERAEKARQFQVMAVSLLVIIALAMLAVFIANGGKAPQRGSGQVRLDEARAACIARSTDRQMAALEKDLRAGNPGISSSELNAKLGSYRSAIENSAAGECKRQFS